MGRLFGTNGVRGIVGEDMTPELALRLGRAVGTWSDGPVLVGRDPRTSGAMFQNALTAGILASGSQVIDAGLCPTPALQYAVKTGAHGSGAIITASHNPPAFNGIKVVAPDGTELGPDTVDELEGLYFDEAFEETSWDAVGGVSYDPGVNERYARAILDQVGPGAADGLKVVLDCANGAGAVIVPQLLTDLGCQVVTLNGQPDGRFPGRKSEPTEENVADTLATVAAVGADVGIILDGDGDRCVFVTEEGTYLPGDKTLALAAGAQVTARGGGTVVTPVSSSQCVEAYVQEKGGQVQYTAVGSPIVAREMMAIDAIFGGEENGGLIFPNHQHCRDGGMAAAWMCAFLQESGRPLSEHVAEIPAYTLVKLKVACPETHKQAALDRFAETVDAQRVDTTDGVKAFHEDGWVLVRPSGTEPLVRVFGESRDPETAEEMAREARERVEKIVDGLTG